jgi:hypothetical protein
MYQRTMSSLRGVGGADGSGKRIEINSQRWSDLTQQGDQRRWLWPPPPIPPVRVELSPALTWCRTTLARIKELDP